MSAKNLPPLAIGTAYVAADFERFEYCRSILSGSKAILRLHLKSGTTIDLQASVNELRHLAAVLSIAFGPDVIDHLKKQRWMK
jgi:hypothetical protein